MIEALLIVSILFGGWQFTRAERLDNKSDELSEKIEEFKEVNDKNGATINDLSDSINACNEAQMEQLDKINQFRAVGEINRAAISTLEARVARSDFGSCVVPPNVNLQSGSY